MLDIFTCDGLIGEYSTINFVFDDIMTLTLISFRHKFKELHIVMNRIAYNCGAYLNRATISHLLIESSEFENPRDRAIEIVGQYPLTMKSLGRVSFVVQACHATSYLIQYN